MHPKPNITYIELPRFYFSNRVVIVSNVTATMITGQVLNLDTWKKNGTRIKRSDFIRRFEVSPVQMR